MAVTKVPAIEGGRSCTEAGEALKYAILGIFCLGFIFGPMSIFKALDAKSIIAKDQSLSGSGKATAALIIGCIVSLLWVLGIIARVSAH
jgi:hypothetical protein